MAAIAIRAERLGKRYRIGAAVDRPDTVREAITRAAGAPLRRLRRLCASGSRARPDDANVVWALRDASFEVIHGEVVGIIGANGAGKSTLLKVLSRITEPTTGFADIHGRVGSLLEVGTGFHQELTGRENIYLNGSILGMDRGYIDRRFEEIVEFAGIARFLDTPVKRYSSGMYLRLAFSVAAHFEPDVLIVDEVLAVGDAEFQQKCLGRMSEVARHGRTVLFVSHNLGAVQRLCSRALLLGDGEIVAEGKTADVVARYLASGDSEARPAAWIRLSSGAHGGAEAARFAQVRFSSHETALDCRPYPGGPLEIAVRVDAAAPIPRPRLGFELRDRYGTTLITGSTYASGSTTPLPEGRSTWRFSISRLPLQPGLYQLGLWLGDALGAIHDCLEPALRLEVVDRQERGWGPRFDPRYDGFVFCEYEIAAVVDGDATEFAAPRRRRP
jgi:lipopolysaccharide transport system ATP-binding protein